MSTIFSVQGEPASKANQRRLVRIKNRPAFIKSKKALDYENTFRLQCPVLDPLMEGDLQVWIWIYYASRRPDLDESVILDCMQKRIYLNDRQVKHKHVFHGLDKEHPRSIIWVGGLDEKAPEHF